MGGIHMPGIYQSSITDSLSKAAEHLIKIQKAAEQAAQEVKQEKAKQQGGQ
jgi:hypothetical protein